MSATVISVGSINLDLQVRTDEPIEPGATREARDFLAMGGGKAANRAYLARALGVPAQLFGSVGADDFAERALHSLRERGVDVSSVHRSAKDATGISLIMVGQDGDKTILHAANANRDWRPDQIKHMQRAIAHAQAGSVLCIDLEVSSEACGAAIRAARDKGLTVVLDPSPTPEMTAELYSQLDYITPNPIEAERLTGVAVHTPEDGLRAAEVLAARGVRTPCVKLQGGGCALLCSSERRIIVAADVPVVDKSGAGDAFAGALSVALLERAAPLEAARWAVAAACLDVGAYGSQADFIDRPRLERVLARVKVAG